MPEVIPDDSPLRVFIYHGIRINSNGGSQSINDCPFCGVADKFYINRERGLYDCKVCGKSGNPIEFLRTLHTESFSTTTLDQYKELATERKYLSVSSLQEWGLVFSRLRDEWVIPGFYKGNPSIKNLYRYTDYGSKDGKKHLQSTPTLAHCLYGVRDFDEDKKDVYVCEGPWDAIALKEILSCIRITSDGTYEIAGNPASSMLANVNVIALPSTTTLTRDWATILSGKRVFLLLDNDYPREVDGVTKQPGTWAAYKRITKKLVEWDVRPESMYFLHWGHGTKEQTYNTSLPNGYDVRDQLALGYEGIPKGVGARIKAIETRIQNLDKLYSYIKPVPDEWINSNPDATISSSEKGKQDASIKLLKCESWQQVRESWKNALVFHRGLEKTLSVMLACITSTMLRKDQLWIRVISPPSTGKSVLCDAVCVHRKYVIPMSNMKGFYSGMRPKKNQEPGEGGSKKRDLGAISDIMNKTFVTKDGDTLLSANERERILSEGRDLYDGKSSTHYRNGMGREYNNIRATWILCGTEALRELDTSELGERFLDCVVIDKITPDLEDLIVNDAIDDMFDGMSDEVTDKPESMDTPKILLSKQLTGGYIDYLRRNCSILVAKVNVSRDEFIKTQIKNLAKFVSFMRARPSKKQEESAQRELSARLAKQLARLASCLAVVMNKEKIDNEVMMRVTEVAFDTSRGTVFNMTRELYKNKSGLMSEVLRSRLDQKDERTTEMLRHLRRIRAFETYEDMSNSAYGETKYRLTPELRTLCDAVFSYDVG